MVFIDGSNLYHVLSQMCGRHDLRFGKFVEKLTSGRDLVRAYYYNVRQDRAHNPAAAQEQDRFLTSLEEVPYLETRLGIYKQRGVEMVEKGVDVMIATDLVSGAFKNLYDTAILVSGDGDFFPAIEAVKDLGKHVEVAAFENNLSPEAGRAADVTTLLRPSYFTTLWTARSRTAAGQGGTGGRQRGAAGHGGAEETPPTPPVAPAEEEEVVGRLEGPEAGAPAERVEEPAAAEKPPQRERRRYGPRRRGGAGAAGGGGAAGRGAGRGPGGPSD
ncbi:MAG: NYN domain-containing protein, partial [Chloroflexi bacterium]|nr:NYN domain-containing protein [Chloroflexota bacterium]